MTGLLSTISTAAQALNSVVETATAPIAQATCCVQAATQTAQSAMLALVKPLSLAQTRVNALLGSVDNAATLAKSVTDAVSNRATPQAIQSLLSANTGLATALPLQSLSATLGRMKANIAAASPGASAKTIQVNGGNLQTIAAQQYGDATLWPAIAQVNGLTDPMLAGVAQTLQIPALSVAQGGIA